MFTNVQICEALPRLLDRRRIYVMGTFKLPDDGIILVSRNLDRAAIDEIVQQKYGARSWVRGL